MTLYYSICYLTVCAINNKCFKLTIIIIFKQNNAGVLVDQKNRVRLIFYCLPCLSSEKRTKIGNKDHKLGNRSQEYRRSKGS